MIKNYMTIALRNLRRHKRYAIINILGLSLGMACFILILLFVQDELSYDQFHTKGERIFRVSGERDKFHFGSIEAHLAPAIKTTFPEVENVVRLKRWGRPLFRYNDKTFYEKWFLFADATLFDIFSFDLIKGDPKTALAEPFSLVITEKAARKYFGSQDPFGQSLTSGEGHEYKITGIVKDLPRQSHIQFDMLGSLITTESLSGKTLTDRNTNNHGYFTFVLLANAQSHENLEAKFPTFVDQHFNALDKTKPILHLQPFQDIYLANLLDSEIGIKGHWSLLVGLGGFACLILLIACINFMNLATARASYRAREVGLRKVVGARRVQIASQFLSESMLFSSISLIIAIATVELFLPAFNTFLNTMTKMDWKHLTFFYADHATLFISLIGLTLVVGLISGSYPALFLSAFQPISVLKGNSGKRFQGKLRKALVVTQFTGAIVLLVSATILYVQIDYVKNKDLGFNSTHMITLPLLDKGIRKHYPTLKKELLKNPKIISVTASSHIPMPRMNDRKSFKSQGKWEEHTYLRIDSDFVQTYDLNVVAGRPFSDAYATDRQTGFILNETATHALGWPSPEQAIGQPLEMKDRQKGQIIGVVKDFHFTSLHFRVEPVVLYMGAPTNFPYISIKTAPVNFEKAHTLIQQTWTQVLPHTPFQATALETTIEQIYLTFVALNQMVGTLAWFALFIACLGLFALSAFMAERKTKEIAIRKVLGASSPSMLYLLSKELIKLVIIANVIACPIIFYLMQAVLNAGFAYKITLHPAFFLLGGLFTLTLALTTVSYQTHRTAKTNPADALRNE